MIARTTTYVLLVLVFAMIVLGGIVHGTGSSLACPDWPLCYGELMPPMQGGILFEHSHRLLGAGIGLAVIVLSLGLYQVDSQRIRGGWLYRLGFGSVLCQLLVFGIAVSTGALGSLWLEALLLVLLGISLAGLIERGMRLTALGLVALELVVIQGLLGGLTVVLRLPPIVSTIHLSIAMSLLAGLAYLAVRLHPDARLGRAIGARAGLWVAIAAVFVQIVSGAFMRHTGATLACGTDVLTCQGSVIGTGGAAHTALFHRWFAIAVALVVTLAVTRLLRAEVKRRAVRFLAGTALTLLVVQIALGFFALVHYVPLTLASAHQAVAALLFVDLMALVAVSGPWGARLDVEKARRDSPSHSSTALGAT